MNDAPAASPAILLAMTAMTGVVDAVSFLAMGHVFTANMTGNIVLLGFALAGAAGLSVTRSSMALIVFLAVAVGGGRMTLGVSGHRWVSRAFLMETSLLALSAALAIIYPLQPYAVIASTGVAMGLRNAVVGKLGVADLTTTVLTLTITGLRNRAYHFKPETAMKIVIGFVLSFLIGAGCRYFDIPAASPPVIPGALIVLAMTLGYTSMDRVLIRKDRAATTKHLCGGPTGLPKAMADAALQADRSTRGRS
jgi:XapX domain-containing protein